MYFLCDILWSEVESHSDNSHMHATDPHSARALPQARPTMSCIHLLIFARLSSISSRWVVCFNFWGVTAVELLTLA